MKKLFAIFCAICALIGSSSALAAEAVETEPVQLPIIMYHHMSSDVSRLGDYIVTPGLFEDDLKYLSERGYTTVSAQQLIDYVDKGIALPERSVMITFDDGQESFKAYALPLLEKYNMCAVVSVVGKYADVYTATEDHNINYSYFTWNQIRDLSECGRVEIGCHTQDLHNIDGSRRGCMIMKNESDESYSEMLNSDLNAVERRIESVIGYKPYIFTYPYGLYCQQSQEIVAERGYRVVLTCDERVNTLTGDADELMRLGRFNRSAKIGRAEYFSKLGIA